MSHPHQPLNRQGANEQTVHSIAFLQPQLYAESPLWFAVRSGNLTKLKEAIRRQRITTEYLLTEGGRGPEGETLLHAAVLFLPTDESLEADSPFPDPVEGQPNQRSVAKYLIDTFGPDLVNAVYAHDRYRDETALHLAVVKGDLQMAAYLIRNGAKVNCSSVSGYSFLPDEVIGDSRKGAAPGYMYYGPSVLSFAAVAGRTKVVKYLLSLEGNSKPDVLAVDDQGNTVLHVLAYWGLFSDSQDGSAESCWDVIFNYCTDNLEPAIHPSRHKNNNGHTPFLTGVVRKHINALESIKVPLWEFGMVSSYMYPIDEIDTWRDPSDVDQDTSSALEIAIANADSDMLMHPMMNLVLRIKWEKYAKKIFVKDLALHIFVAICITVSIALLPPNHGDWNTYSTGDAKSIVRACFEVASVLGILFMLLRESIQVILEGYRYWTGSMWDQVEAFSIWAFILMGIAVTVVRPMTIGSAAVNTKFDTIGIELLSFLAWMFTLTYFKGFPRLGTLAVVFHRCVSGDLLNWAAIYVVLFLSFGQIFILQTRDNSGNAITGWGSYGVSLLNIFGYMFGQGSPISDFQQSQDHEYTLAAYFIYQTASAIVLLNVLIAMFNTTFSKIYDDAETQWHLQWASMIIQLDRRLHNESASPSGGSAIIHGLQRLMGPPKVQLGTKIPLTRADGSFVGSRPDRPIPPESVRAYAHYFIVRARLATDNEGKYVQTPTPIKVITGREEYRVPETRMKIWSSWSVVTSKNTLAALTRTLSTRPTRANTASPTPGSSSKHDEQQP
ncbi:uncharacterized protein BJ171DRAFT_521495 [Polychytrium aggregatum]|uniref:uncharacterized protein n=1 Tax=Polychytrium aggregatum TaxID=110093 RepID=UPI0022FF0F1C|nr:uncharacterized protein BJ171DRAFT_521495 [Polychytrium aggregatum]KAI9197199.1 hypothetical protein BJ171DRAFT_521495 [Polychytrium aggregatum]